MTEDETDFPKEIGNPARRALVANGYTRLEQLAAVTERELADLHGVGPKAVSVLREALKTSGSGFSGS